VRAGSVRINHISKTVKISIFGLGYVGAVTAACLATDGHEVVGVDVDPSKVEIINDGRSPIVEEGLGELISEAVRKKLLRATTDVGDAVNSSDVSMICVGTPSNENGSLKLDFVERVSRQIGESLSRKTTNHVVVVRSTMLPGTVDELVTPTLQMHSGKTVGKDLHVCVNPEFLREGSSIKDFYSPPFIIVGVEAPEVAETLRTLYSKVGAPLLVTSIRTAEMVKYACNSFHALKVSFANEIGNLCKEMKIDGHKVMELFCEDKKLNLSSNYLRPGFAFGGSCLPKDLRALQYRAKELDLAVPVLEATLTSNIIQIERAIQMVVKTGKKKIGVLGFSFKAGTDDLRESPVVAIIERLIGKGFDVRLFDRDVSIAKLVGANKKYIEREIPHISKLMSDNIAQVLDNSEVLIIGNRDPEFESLFTTLKSDTIVIDLVRATRDRPSDAQYQGICW
jgi:GDP-mannose 6-dehydrogenase